MQQAIRIGAVLGLSLVASHTLQVQTRARTPLAVIQGGSMTLYARGPFEVKLSPQKPDNPQAEGAGLGRMSIAKQFHGDLEATSQGEMLAIRTDVANSAGYVAIERVTGSLHGRHGSFVLQHSSTMDRGAPKQNVAVVPDSGSGELAGLTGTMTINIAEGGRHSYEFEYRLPE